jgi:hypothetical protein
LLACLLLVILNNEPFTTTLNLKGIALGNACWGGNETLVVSLLRARSPTYALASLSLRISGSPELPA